MFCLFVLEEEIQLTHTNSTSSNSSQRTTPHQHLSTSERKVGHTTAMDASSTHGDGLGQNWSAGTKGNRAKVEDTKRRVNRSNARNTVSISGSSRGGSRGRSRSRHTLMRFKLKWKGE